MANVGRYFFYRLRLLEAFLEALKWITEQETSLRPNTVSNHPTNHPTNQLSIKKA
jgi:hypothetical protein